MGNGLFETVENEELGDNEGDWFGGAFGDFLAGIPFVSDMIKSGRDREQQGYDRNLTAVQMGREDTAVQRRVADMEAAGINPIMAAGAPAMTGSMSRSTAPESGGGRGVLDAVGTAIKAKMAKAGVERLKHQNDLSDAQADLAKAGKAKVDQDVDIAGDLRPSGLSSAESAASIAEVKAEMEELHRNMYIAAGQEADAARHLVAVSDAELRSLENDMVMAVRRGETSFEYGAWTGRDGVRHPGVFIDVTKTNSPAAVAAMIAGWNRDLASANLDAIRQGIDLRKLDIQHYVKKMIFGMASSVAGTVSGFMPSRVIRSVVPGR